jgi:hypothetical protein
MRSRREDIDPQQTIDRALAMGVVGFGDAAADDRLERRVGRFADVADGSYVWTRDIDGLYWLGRIDGPLFHDDDGAAVDLVHVRPCRWVTDPVLEPEVPAAVLATFARGGRNFQQTHDPNVGEQTAAIWRQRARECTDEWP